MWLFFLKFFAIFWAIWITWYITGGPLRDNQTHLFVNYSTNATTTVPPLTPKKY